MELGKNYLLLSKVWSLLSEPARGGRVLLGIRGGGVPPGSPNPDPTHTKKCHSTPVVRPDL